MRILRNLTHDLQQLIIDEIDDVFEYTVFCDTDLVSRPFEGKLWVEKLAEIPKENYRRLQIIYNFYDISYVDYLQLPLFEKLIKECGENGDFDAYDCKEKDIYSFFKNYTSVRDDFYFGHYLAQKIKERISEEYEKMDIAKIGNRNELFAETSRDVDNNKYLDEKQKADIKDHILSKRLDVLAKRRY